MASAQEIKDKIVKVLQQRGPCLPVHLSKEVNQSILFTSAFLSELLAEKRIFQSNMKVGSSSLFFLRGQEFQLEKFQDHIKGKEKEALVKLKDERFLNDETQNPPIRVALRFIKDFAIPFKDGEKLMWRYYLEDEANYKSNPIKELPKEEPKPEIKKDEQVRPSTLADAVASHKEPKEDLNIFDDDSKKNSGFSELLETPKTSTGGSSSSDELVVGDSKSSEEEKPKKTVKKKATKKVTKKTSTKEDKFFNKVKEFLAENSIELLEIEGFNKTSVTLKVKKDSEEILLIAHNKKKLTEKEFIDAQKKASEAGLKYIITSTGEQTKKLTNFIEAIQNMQEIGKIE